MKYSLSRHLSVLAVASLLLFSMPLGARSKKKTGRSMRFEATAHSVEGTTAAGTKSRPGTVAADPDVIPLGSRIRVSGAGGYSGRYTVVDTGPAVQGRHIDIYVPSDREAKQFGRKTVRVTILERGEGKADAREKEVARSANISRQ